VSSASRECSRWPSGTLGARSSSSPRDRVGVKPLYYAVLPGAGILFGSEIKAILQHPAVPRALDEEAFWDYLTFAFTPPPRTMFRGIGKLAPAERMVVDARGGIRRDIWWDPLGAPLADQVAEMSEREMVDEVRRLLKDSIGKRMMSFGVSCQEASTRPSMSPSCGRHEGPLGRWRSAASNGVDRASSCRRCATARGFAQWRPSTPTSDPPALTGSSSMT
jgi:hypothetical protein